MSTLLREKSFVDIAVALPLFTTFTYTFPKHYRNSLHVGTRVLVPFGKRHLTGYIVGFPHAAPDQELREIIDILDEEPLFDENDLAFYRWVSSYYYYPLGQTIKAALPRGLTLEYARAAAVTPKGREALALQQPGTREYVVLRELADCKQLSLKQLEKKVGKEGFVHVMRTLETKKLIAYCLKRKTQGISIRKEKWFSPGDTSADCTLGKKQEEIFLYIVQYAPVSLIAIKERFGNCSSSLQALDKKGLLHTEEREIFRRPAPQERIFAEPAHVLSPEQKKITDRLAMAMKKNTFYPFLLYGVTGSGKTEIYLHTMQFALQEGKQCLYMVPEIALTAQLLDRISSRLSRPVAMLHSSLTAAERYDAWRMIKRGRVKVVIGARSAVFASFLNLGAIIVDEEHDPSYKQDDTLRYNARDLSLIKAKNAGCIVVLGSATPSFESFHNAVKKKYFHGLLEKRVDDKPLPHVSVVDMTRQKQLRTTITGIISRQLHRALEQRISRKQQSLLFLNRRGFSPSFICQECGSAFTCPNCEVSLIHHRGFKRLCCHYCDFSLPVPEQCSHCGSLFLMSLGWGTERLEKEIQTLFPAARVARMDKDTTTSKGASRTILKDMYQRNIDILIGTQMIVKGYHLPNVTLVGVICADQSLNFPDYRAGERTFQLLTQVAGRAGRGDCPGEVIIQTYNPEHYSILCSRHHDYRKFYKTEMTHRKNLGYPPYKKMILIRFEGMNKKHVAACAQKAGTWVKDYIHCSDLSEEVEVLGPARSPWEKIKGRYRFHMVLRAGRIKDLRLCAAKTLNYCNKTIQGTGVRCIVDVDPLFMM